MNTMRIRDLAITALQRHRARVESVGPCEHCGTCAGGCTGIFSNRSAGAGWWVDRASLPAGSAVGDQIRLEIDPLPLARRACLVYGLPLAGLLLGALVTRAFGVEAAAGRDALAAVSALTGMVVGLLAGRLILRAATPAYRFTSRSPIHVSKQP